MFGCLAVARTHERGGVSSGGGCAGGWGLAIVLANVLMVDGRSGHLLSRMSAQAVEHGLDSLIPRVERYSSKPSPGNTTQHSLCPPPSLNSSHALRMLGRE